MWEQLIACWAKGEGRVAFCIPWPTFSIGPWQAVEPALPIYWYGILAAAGIFVGAMYASKHVEWEGGDPEEVWDLLLWLVIPALIGARLWYVAQDMLNPSSIFISNPLEILNTRQGGMHIFGGILFGLIALFIYTRVTKIDGWLMADAGLLALLVGQAIGRIGNYVNRELYGPPTNIPGFGMLVLPVSFRPAQYRNLPLETLFHPTMFYEMGWLLLCFVVLVYLFRRYQERLVHGMMAGAYMVLVGIGRFVIEYWRIDQPKLPDTPFSYSQLAFVGLAIAGLVVLGDRTGYLKIPWIERPQTRRQRQQAYQSILEDRRRLERAAQKDKLRTERRRQRAAARQSRSDQTADSAEES